MLPKEILIEITFVLLTVLLAVVIWIIRLRYLHRGKSIEINKCSDTELSNESEVLGQNKPPLDKIIEISKSPSIIEESAPFYEKLSALTIEVSETDLREMLTGIADRVKEVGPVFGEDTSLHFVEEMVDRLDDLRAVKTQQGIETMQSIDSFCENILNILDQCGAEIIRSDHWDPSLQRAIAKEPNSEIEAPVILRFGSSGFRRYGQLIRKQEIVLATPAAADLIQSK